MFNRKQVEKIPVDLGLSYYWNSPEQGASSIIVENKIEFKHFSHWVTDLRTGEKFHNDNKFYELCEELSKNK
jgi:hypothetical protein